MKFIYDFFIILAFIICQPLRLLSSKINLSYKGRKKAFKILKKEVNPNEKNIWFHVSSLGEFEIAKPIIEILKNRFDNLNFKNKKYDKFFREISLIEDNKHLFICLTDLLKKI